MNVSQQPRPEVLFPNLKRRFSGITSTMIQVVPRQADRLPVAVVGHPLPGTALPRLGWGELLRRTAGNHPGGYPTIFHARRNDDMIVGLLLKKLLRRRLHLVFTSVAQRRHTAFTRWLYQRMDTLLSTSERSASYLRRKPHAIIPHGVDTKTYHPATDRAAAWAEGGLPGKFGIGIFGRVRPNKGHAEFVEALCRVLPEYPDFTAVVVGETLPRHQAFEQDMKHRIADAGLEDRFAWLGKLPFEQIPDWFRRMSLVAAVPHNEGFGLTCLEAMASGAPVLATRAGGFEMVIEEGKNGRLVPVRDTTALGAAFRELLADPERLAAMGVDARRRIEEKFTVLQEADALLAVYRNIQQSYS